MQNKNNINSIQGINLVRKLAEEGHRIFDINTAKDLGRRLGIKESYINECLYHLKNSEWIIPLKKGIYTIPPILLSGNNITEYEIATSLVKPSAICCLSAMNYHGLTEQIPYKFFVLTTTIGRSPKRTIGRNGEIMINNIYYHFLSIKEESFFGIEEVWIGDAKVPMTNIERTLIDGIIKPKYCGGFAEVIQAFKNSYDRLDINKLIIYAKKIGNSATRRLGWIFDYLNIHNDKTKVLVNNYIGYIKLNVSGQNKGHLNKKWGVIENI